jgi:hypothetical protein
LLKFLADPYNQLPAITFWLLGSLAATHPADLTSLLPAVAIGLVPLGLLRWRIDVMTLGDEEAAALGVNTRVLRIVVIAAATLMTSAAVAASGIIGWVGLVVPHLTRLIVGPAFTRLMPVSVLFGACYLLAVDTVARTLGTVELPLGVLTAALGTPVFLWLLAFSRRPGMVVACRAYLSRISPTATRGKRLASMSISPLLPVRCCACSGAMARANRHCSRRSSACCRLSQVRCAWMGSLRRAGIRADGH